MKDSKHTTNKTDSELALDAMRTAHKTVYQSYISNESSSVNTDSSLPASDNEVIGFCDLLSSLVDCLRVSVCASSIQRC